MYTATEQQKAEEARVEALAARHEAQRWINYAKRLAAKWGLNDIELVAKMWGR